jgi:putative colanic acid biosynthesis glycosyltransferase
VVTPPILSIITIVYNGADELQYTIDSVRKIKREEVEYIVIDGGSKDGTVNIIERNLNVINKFITESDNGIYDAMNKGIDLASGDYIIFMNAGDIFSDYFNTQDFLLFLSDNRNPDIVYSDSIQQVGSKQYLNEINDKFQNWWLKSLPCHQCCFIKLDVLMKNKFNLKLKVSADSAQLISLFNTCNNIKYGKPIAIFELGGVSNSWTSLRQLWHHLNEMTSVRKLTLINRCKIYTLYLCKFFIIKSIGYQKYYQISYKLKRKKEL